jgi:hypothetical protein
LQLQERKWKGARSSSNASSPIKRKRKPRISYNRHARGIGVARWNIKFGGQWQKLLDFLNEVAFMAEAESISNSELFRSAYHLLMRLYRIRSWAKL